jgi:hypothetical protein
MDKVTGGRKLGPELVVVDGVQLIVFFESN